MKLGKFLLIILVLSFFTPLILSSQPMDENLKITTANVMIYRVFITRMGFVVEYYSGDKLRRTYLPNSFIMNKTVVKIIEDDAKITPQMNVIYKNEVPFKIKLYIPSVYDGYTYQIIETMSDDLVEKFKNTTKLEIELKDE